MPPLDGRVSALKSYYRLGTVTSAGVSMLHLAQVLRKFRVFTTWMDIENVICFWGFCDDETLSENLKLVSEPGVRWLAYLAALLGITLRLWTVHVCGLPWARLQRGMTGPLGRLSGIFRGRHSCVCVTSEWSLIREPSAWCLVNYYYSENVNGHWLFCLVFAGKVLRGSTVTLTRRLSVSLRVEAAFQLHGPGNQQAHSSPVSSHFQV